MRDRQCALNHDATESAPIVSGVINKSEAMRDRQCALNHDATESAPIVSGVINKPTTVELCISHVY